MKRIIFLSLATTLALACGQNTPPPQSPADSTGITPASLTDQDIADAYVYLLARELMLKQEQKDFEEGAKWNRIIYRIPGDIVWPNPNLDIAYNEAWVAVDENNCTLLQIPEIKNRYYTWQMVNGWGETLLNINERTFPNHAYGKFALCLKGSEVKVPDGFLRIDLPSKTSRILARIELGKDTKEAVRLQHLFKLIPHGEPKTAPRISVPYFEGQQFPDAAMFTNATEKMQADSDINAGMTHLQQKVTATQSLVKTPTGKTRVDSVIRHKGIPLLFESIQNRILSKNGWYRPTATGNYGDDYKLRTAVDYARIWANNKEEVTYFVRKDIDGGMTYTLMFPKEALPSSKADYFWSVIAVDSVNFRVLPNAQKRYLLSNQSGPKPNRDGSLTLVFGPKPLPGYPDGNWLPTIPGQKYNLTFRFYGPHKDVTDGSYFPPELRQEK
jgi:hypothetical protein